MKMIKFLKVLTVILFCCNWSAFSQPVPEEKDTERKNALNLFLDCRTCDMNYTREEIPYVNYVRDVKEAQVFVLVTQQSAGSGGNQYTYTFAGQGSFAGMNDTLEYTTNPNQTSSEIRDMRTKLLKLGLMRFVARTPLASEIEISHNIELKQEEVVDNWNYWVFRLSSSPRYTAEETRKTLNLMNSLEISRVTPELKFEMEIDQSINRRRFISEFLDTTYIKNGSQVNLLLVKSLGDHWSAGIKWDNSSSTEDNLNFMTEFSPTIEYDLFPYSEATHKQLRFQYSAGYNYSNYIDTTKYLKLYDNLYKQQLQIAYQVQEKWGSINASISGGTLLTDLSKVSTNLNARISLRIIKGLSLSVNGGASYNNFQPGLRKGNVSEADRLLQLKQIASGYTIQGSVSLSYTFGSIYNNVVNPRFGNGGGGGGGYDFF